MQVETRIDEADIGRVQPGLKATFTVDAFPDATFEGTVRQVRLAPTVEQNVVTYTTVIDVPNPEQKLKPGMTANVTIGIERKDDVLKVANAALRFRPPAEGGDEEGRRVRRLGAACRRPGARSRRHAARRRCAGGHAQDAWRPGQGHHEADRVRARPGNVLQPVAVETGITDGTFTEVKGGALADGAAVVVGAMPKAGPSNMQAPPPGMGGFGGGPRGGGGGGGRGGGR
jgi:HlyD family secretion protein